MKIALVAAASDNNVIGDNNALPWRMPADMKFFKELTTGHPVIMGRKTYYSFGKPLKNRQNIIISRDKNLTIKGCVVVNSLKEAIKEAKKDKEVFIIGGAEIYRQSMKIADKIYLTRIHSRFDGDAFFPEIKERNWKLTECKEFEPDEKNPYPFAFMQFKKK